MDTTQLTFTNWGLDPNLIETPQHLVPWDLGFLSDRYDYAQLLISGSTQVADAGNESNVTLTEGQWIPKDADNRHYFFDNGFLTFEQQDARIVLEFDDAPYTPSVLSISDGNGYMTSSDDAVRRQALIEMSLDQIAECGYLEDNSCEYCLTDTTFSMEKYTLNYLGQTESSITTMPAPMALMEVMNEPSVNWNNLEQHLVHISKRRE